MMVFYLPSKTQVLVKNHISIMLIKYITNALDQIPDYLYEDNYIHLE
jgi:hypothetical protein